MNAPYEEHRDASFQAELYLKRTVTGEAVSCQSAPDIYRRLKAARENVERIEMDAELTNSG